MKREEYWQQFTQSGLISDYLAFKSHEYDERDLNSTTQTSEKGGYLAFNSDRGSHPTISG